MAPLTKLFVFSSPTSLSAQLTAMGQPQATVDHLLFNTDDAHQEFIPLTIDAVRTLQLEVLRPPVHADIRHITIGNIEGASHPAQQAILKILEEPPEHIQLQLTTQAYQKLLPTLISRCQLIRPSGETTEKTTPQPVAAELPTPDSSLHELFTLSEKYKDRADAQQYFATLIQTIHQDPAFPTAAHTRQIHALLEANSLLEKNVNVRLVVEEALFRLTRAIVPGTPPTAGQTSQNGL